MIDYRKGSDDLKKAWFEYKKSNPNKDPNTKLRLVDFAAGYNACLQKDNKDE